MPEAALLLVPLHAPARGGRARAMCLNVVLEVSAERQHEEGRSEEDGGTGVRAGIDGERKREAEGGTGREREKERGRG